MGLSCQNSLGSDPVGWGEARAFLPLNSIYIYWNIIYTKIGNNIGVVLYYVMGDDRMNIRQDKPKRYKITHIKNRKLKYKRKGDDIMFAYNELLDKNSRELWELATESSKYNSKGKCIISEDEEDYTHDEWDELYPKELLKEVCE